jgi:4-carboxymuconolactone decarboxylase
MARYQDFTPDSMTAQQRTVYDDIVAGPRGRIYGPFLVLMHNPGLASALQKSGAYVRWQSDLDENFKELAIATIGRYWGAHVEWSVHAKLAVDAGVDPAIIDALEAGTRPVFADAGEALIHEFCTALLETKRIGDDLYGRPLALLGETGLIDFMALFTHYTTISLTLNSFQVPAPAGFKAPSFPHGRFPDR